MRKLIRFTAVAFLVWAVTTFAWAAISHVSELPGPARASAATLEFVAGALTWLDPPGVLGTPQRFAARQLHRGARSVERLHRGPERAAARIVDRLGHDRAHRGHRWRIRDVRRERDVQAWRIPLEEIEGVAEQARARARIEMERHRHDGERLRHRMERQRIEYRLEAMERARMERLERSAARLRELAAEAEGDLRRRIEDRIREILRELEHELEDARQIELDFHLDDVPTIELEGVDGVTEIEGPVRILIRER